MAIQISNWVTELQKRTNLQGTDRILMGISDTGESLYTTVADLAGVVTGSTVVNRGNWASGTEYKQGDYVFAESTSSPSERSMYFLIGTNPYVSNIPPKDDLSKWSELPAIKGDQGVQGVQGEKGDPLTWDDLTPAQKESLKGDVGDSGWSMLVRAEVDNVNLDPDGQYRKVLYVYDWVGGEGTKPTITGYIGVSGIVANIINAENWRGSRGAQGLKGDAPAHEWVGTSVRFQNPNGTWGALTDLRGVQGIQGIKGDPPAHGWNGTSLRFQNPDGSWGAYVDLKGEKGEMGEGLQIDASGPLSGRSAYDGEPVNFVYWATDENLFYIRANPTGWSVGQSLGSVANFIQLDDTPSSYSGQGGKAVAVKSDASGLEFVDKGVPYTGADKMVDLNTQEFKIGGIFEKGVDVLDVKRLNAFINTTQFNKVINPANWSVNNASFTPDQRWVIKFPKNTGTATEFSFKIDIFTNAYLLDKLTIDHYGVQGSLYFRVLSSTGNVNRVINSSDATHWYIIIDPSLKQAYARLNISEVYTNVAYLADIFTNKNFFEVLRVDPTTIPDRTIHKTVTNSQFTRDPFYAFKTDIIGTAGQLPFTNSAGTGIEKRKIAPSDLNMFTVGTILGNIGGNLGELSLSSSVENNSVARRTTYGSLKASDAVANDDLVALGQVNTRFNNLAEVASSGDYDDLSNKPAIPSAQVNSDWNATSGVAEILNKPTIGNGTLSLATGTGLTGSASFSANQSGAATFTVGVAGTHKLPTTTEWNSKAVIGTGANQVRNNTQLDSRYAQTANLGTAAAKNVGTAVGNVVEVQTGGKLPTLDGSNLTNLPSAGGGKYTNIRTVTGSTTLAAGDIGGYVRITSTTNETVTIPAGLGNIGDIIDVALVNPTPPTAQLAVLGASGVTINLSVNAILILPKWRLIKVGTNSWDAIN